MVKLDSNDWIFGHQHFNELYICAWIHIQQIQHEEYDVDSDSRNTNGKQIEHTKSVKFYYKNLLLLLGFTVWWQISWWNRSVAEREIARRIWHYTEHFLFADGILGYGFHLDCTFLDMGVSINWEMKVTFP